MFKLYDAVKLKENDKDAHVSSEYIGTIVDILFEGIYTVEFVDENGETVMPALNKIYRADQLILA